MSSYTREKSPSNSSQISQRWFLVFQSSNPEGNVEDVFFCGNKHFKDHTQPTTGRPMASAYKDHNSLANGNRCAKRLSSWLKDSLWNCKWRSAFHRPAPVSMEYPTWDMRDVEFRGCTEKSFAFRVGVLGGWRNLSAWAVSFPRAGIWYQRCFSKADNCGGPSRNRDSN